MPAEGDLHGVRVLLPQARAALQVGEQEGQGSGRGRLHVPIIGLQRRAGAAVQWCRWLPPSPRRSSSPTSPATPATSPTSSSTTPRTSSPTSSAPWSPPSGPSFRLAKLEGDAAFTFAIGETHRRVDAARHHRALLLRLPPPPARRPPGDVVRVQRLRPDPGPRPQVRRPPRRGDPPEGRRPAGAARVGRDRRPSAAQERGRRADRDRGLRPAQPGQHRCVGPRRRPRSACARTSRPTTGSATCRPGCTTSSGAGRRRRPARASSSTPEDVDPHGLGADDASRRRSPGSS